MDGRHEVYERLATRAGWEAHSAVAGMRRRVLDLVMPPRRERALLERGAQSVPDLVAGIAGREPDPGATTGLRLVPAPAAVEPEFGYVVHGRLGVVESSLPFASYARRRRDRIYFSGVPRLRGLLRRGVVDGHDDAVLSVANPYGNYFHAIVDTCASLAQLDALGVLGRRPLVISPHFAGTQVFAALRERGAFDHVDLRCHPDGWVSSTTGVLFTQPGRHRSALVRTQRYLLDALGAWAADAPGADAPPRPGSSEDGDDDVKLYLTRSTGEGRRARNEDELVEVTRAHGFAAVDPGVLSWPAQVDLFRRASHVVGVHGAAFTNVLFRWPAPLRILEIESPHGSEDVFRSMATELGFEMTSLRGTNPSDSSNRPEFDVDATAVDRVLRRWTDEPAPRDPSIATVGG